MKPKHLLKYATDWNVGDLHITVEETGYSIARDGGREFMTVNGAWMPARSLPVYHPDRFFGTLREAVLAAEADCERRGVKDAGFQH